MVRKRVCLPPQRLSARTAKSWPGSWHADSRFLLWAWLFGLTFIHVQAVPALCWPSFLLRPTLTSLPSALAQGLWWSLPMKVNSRSRQSIRMV